VDETAIKVDSSLKEVEDRKVSSRFVFLMRVNFVLKREDAAVYE